MADTNGTVLVTGGTGFLGGWCIAELLRARPRRAHDRPRRRARAGGARRRSSAAGVDAGDRLTVVAADLSADDGWAEAVAGCGHVLHVASPFPPEQPKDPDELIVPARDGALRVIEASLDAGVERIVMTSSVAAVRHGRPPSADEPYTEDDWTDGDDTRRTPVRRARRRSPSAPPGSTSAPRRRGPPRDRQPRRDHRPGAERRPLVLAAGGRSGCSTGMPAMPAARLHVRRRARRRRPAHPRDDRSRGRRRALPRHRRVPVDRRRRGDPARAPRRPRAPRSRRASRRTSSCAR